MPDHGKGKAYYLAAGSDLAFLGAFYQDVLKEAGLENPLGTGLPYGVSVTERCTAGDANDPHQKRVVFVMNFKNEPVTVEGIGRWTDAENGESIQGSLVLEPFGCRVLLFDPAVHADGHDLAGELFAAGG